VRADARSVAPGRHLTCRAEPTLGCICAAGQGNSLGQERPLASAYTARPVLSPKNPNAQQPDGPGHRQWRCRWRAVGRGLPRARRAAVVQCPATVGRPLSGLRPDCRSYCCCRAGSGWHRGWAAPNGSGCCG
jgi:hypothetical protein